MEHDILSHDDEVAVYNLCTDTTRHMNGIVTNMHPSEGVWLFRYVCVCAFRQMIETTGFYIITRYNLRGSVCVHEMLSTRTVAPESRQATIQDSWFVTRATWKKQKGRMQSFSFLL